MLCTRFGQKRDRTTPTLLKKEVRIELAIFDTTRKFDTNTTRKYWVKTGSGGLTRVSTCHTRLCFKKNITQNQKERKVENPSRLSLSPFQTFDVSLSRPRHTSQAHSSQLRLHCFSASHQ